MIDTPLDIQQQFKERIDIQYIFMLQVNRCLNAAGTDFFPSHVEALWKILPDTAYRNVENRGDEWVIPRKTLIYKSYCGVDLGSINDPLVRNDKGDWGRSSTQGFDVKRLEDQTVDWSDPNIISPRLIIDEEPDYVSLFKIILHEAELAGLLWNIEDAAIVKELNPTKPFRKTPKRVSDVE